MKGKVKPTSMRKYKRRIARYRMEREGVQHINKPVRTKDGVSSYFSRNWRRYVGAEKD